MKATALACILACGFAAPAVAGASPWFDVMGGSLRLVTADMIEEGGVLRGVLQVRLLPGWKTYWKEPGETGIAPVLRIDAGTGVRDAEILFPPPVRVTDRHSSWAGYDRDVSLAVEFRVDRMPRIAVDVFLGLCETICVPVDARLEVAPRSNAGDAATVAAAFAALPRPADGGFGIKAVSLDGDRLSMHAVLPAGTAAPSLFLVNPQGWEFGVPVAAPAEGGTRFTVPVLAGPDRPADLSIEYVLVAGTRAVSGTARLSR